MGRKSGKNGSLRNTSEIETNNFSCRGSELIGNKQQNTYVAKGLSVFYVASVPSRSLAELDVCSMSSVKRAALIVALGLLKARGVSLSG